MEKLLGFADLIDRLNGRIGRASVWLVLVCVLLSALTATLRYTLDWGSNAMIEAQWFLFGLVFMLCAPWTLQERGHVRVDILYNRFPPRVRVLIDIVGGLLFLLPVSILIVIDAWDYFLLSFHQNEASYNPGGLLWWPMKLVIPVGFVLLAAQGVSEVIKGVAILAGLRPLPSSGGGH
ncbi:TRAP transporter small permease subunit [Imhoffiella purpurea]|uniref:TRAP transporter small permease protein n=1 Tax=Imhoffiella purpurea TaxID=1249627 RepID=W9V5U3_9GAMM|nr:TRAP transporter small permease subunit [Imhoffiella purpurea]EXJ14898.1 TRAP dicarboxylate transporter, DctQ subunit [Imhoffiella purpurea]